MWHTPHGSYDLRKGCCVFVRKGAAIVEQFFDATFCLIVFFIPDDFIRDVLKSRFDPVRDFQTGFQPVITIENNTLTEGYFNSVLPYFEEKNKPDQALLELKFRELILTIAGNSNNQELLSYFATLLKQPQTVSLRDIMESNYCFNLKLEEFARLSNRSLSTFKRDFLKHFGTTPAKWLMEKRLNHALNLLTNAGKSVSEAAFESGFESTSHFSRSFRTHFGFSPGAIKQAG